MRAAMRSNRSAAGHVTFAEIAPGALTQMVFAGSLGSGRQRARVGLQ